MGQPHASLRAGAAGTSSRKTKKNAACGGDPPIKGVTYFLFPSAIFQGAIGRWVNPPQPGPKSGDLPKGLGREEGGAHGEAPGRPEEAAREGLGSKTTDRGREEKKETERKRSDN